MDKRDRIEQLEFANRLDRRKGLYQFGWIIVDPYDSEHILNKHKLFFGRFKKSVLITSGELMGKYKVLIESNLFTHKHVGDKIPTYEVDLDLNVKRLT